MKLKYFILKKKKNYIYIYIIKRIIIKGNKKKKIFFFFKDNIDYCNLEHHDALKNWRDHEILFSV